MDAPVKNVNLDPVIRRFQSQINHFGAQPGGVLWRNAGLQFRRFQLLAEILSDEDKNNDKCSFADFGCGYGALYTWLKDHPSIRFGTYTGYDITGEMIELCRGRIVDKAARFVHAGRMDAVADFVFVSGTFTLKCAASDDEWEQFVQDSLLHLWRFSSTGLAFNFLEDTQSDKDAELYYANSDSYLDYCRRAMSKDVRILRDPEMQEFTLLLRR